MTSLVVLEMVCVSQQLSRGLPSETQRPARTPGATPKPAVTETDLKTELKSILMQPSSPK